MYADQWLLIIAKEIYGGRIDTIKTRIVADLPASAVLAIACMSIFI